MSLLSIRSWFAKGNRAQWCVFGLFCIVLFVKTMLFHFSVDYGILVSSLWKHPTEFFRFWGGKIVPVLFFGSFIFISKRFWWTYVANLIVDLWCIANLFYYKANTLFLSYETMKMADNMSGFWDSLLSYMGWDIVSFVLISIGYAFIVLYFMPHQVQKRSCFLWGLALALSLLISILDNVFYAKVSYSWGHTNSAVAEVHDKMLAGERYKYYFPFGHVYYFARVETCMGYNVWASHYMKEFSILSYFPSCIVYHILRPAGGIVTLTEFEEQQIEAYINQDYLDCSPQHNLVFILFESMESWPLQPICDYEYMPNLSRLIQTEHVLFCDKVKSQVKHGNSADGQMIDVTGLLPISDGATCFMYGNNKFPSYTYLYDNSIFFKANAGLWNQEVITFNYGFRQLVEPQNMNQWEDKQLLDTMCNMIGNIHQPFCVVGFTISSHVPFSHGVTCPTHNMSDAPALLNAYLNCLSYTDSCIGTLIDTIMNSNLIDNTIIVISGDHNIFRSHDENIDKFAETHNLNMRSQQTFTPLIIYSHNIKGNICITDTCYQMDIYPTIMHLIGCEDYYWKGFGVNLLDSVARHNRPITEQEAYRLSDLMIRSNYFKEYNTQK